MRRACVLAALAWIVSPLAAAKLQPGTPDGAPYVQTSTPGRAAAVLPTGVQVDSGGVIAKYCVTCHNEQLKTGDLALDVVSRGTVREHAPVWEEVLHKLRAGSMPPPGMPHPDAAAVTTLMSALSTELDTAPRDPGRPLLRRLNRAEYGNVIRDLLDLEVSDVLPEGVPGP